MKLKLPVPRDPVVRQAFALLERADGNAYKKDEPVEVRTEFILASPNGTRFAVRVDDLGNLTATAL